MIVQKPNPEKIKQDIQNVKNHNIERILKILLKNFFIHWDYPDYLTNSDKKEIVKLIKSKPLLFKELNKAFTSIYHGDNACGAHDENNKQWKEYNKCANNLLIHELKKNIGQGKQCIFYRKLAWYLHTGKQYPLGALNESHMIPIEKPSEYLRVCESYLKQAEKQEKIKEQERTRKLEKKLQEKEIENEQLNKKMLKMEQELKEKDEEMINKNSKKSIGRPRKVKELEIDLKTGKEVLKCKDNEERHPNTRKCVKPCNNGKIRKPPTYRCVKH